MDFRLKNPFSLHCTGASQSGKTSFVFQLLNSRNFLYSKPPGPVHYYYKIWQPLYEEFSHLVTSFRENVPSLEELTQRAKEAPNSTFVFDDLSSDLSSDFIEVVTTMVHHYQMNVIVLSQSMYDSKSDAIRSLNRNCNYVVFFRSPSDNYNIQTLARRVEPTKWKKIVQAFNHSTDQPYSYLLFDFSTTTPRELRFRSNIFFENGSGLRVYTV